MILPYRAIKIEFDEILIKGYPSDEISGTILSKLLGRIGIQYCVVVAVVAAAKQT